MYITPTLGTHWTCQGKHRTKGLGGRLFWVGQNTQPSTRCINSINCCRKKAVSLCLNSFFLKKSLLNLLHCCFCLTDWFFGFEACVILALWPGIEPQPGALESKNLNHWNLPPGEVHIHANYCFWLFDNWASRLESNKYSNLLLTPHFDLTFQM